MKRGLVTKLIKEGKVSEFVIVAPILPGKRGDWLDMMREITGPRYAEWVDHHRRMGVVREVVWEQRFPSMDVAIVCIDGVDPDQILDKLSVSDHPFDIWFRERIFDVAGYLEEAPDDLPPPTLVGMLEAEAPINGGLVAKPTEGSKVSTFLIVAPILPGKRGDWLDMMREITGPRNAEWVASQRRMGAVREVVWEQRFPSMDVMIGYIDGVDPDQILDKLSVSDHPFDIWFRERIFDVAGYLEEAPPDDLPPPTLVGRFEGEAMY